MPHSTTIYESQQRRFESRVASGGVWCCQQVALAKRSGMLPSPRNLKCEDCARPAVEYDHRDYNRPLSVSPVCRRCNLHRGPAVPLADPLMAVMLHVTNPAFAKRVARHTPGTNALDPWLCIPARYRSFARSCFKRAQSKKSRLKRPGQFADAVHGGGTSVHEDISPQFAVPGNHLTTGAASGASSSQLVTT